MSTAINDIRNKILREEKKVKIFLVAFYIVGVFGIAMPFTRNFFTNLTLLALLVSLAVLVIFHQAVPDKRSLSVFLVIFAFGYLIEVAGVKTGLLFGNYSYGNGLGVKVIDTPLMIGLNWLLLVYCTSIITNSLPAAVIVKILLSSLLMVIYDIAMEQIAPQLNMWQFEGGVVPVRNYLSWFIIAVSLQFFTKLTGIRYENRLAAFIFILQLVFFISLIAIFKLIQ